MEPLAADDPRTMGDYRLLRRLGAGGMGRVYLGRSPGGRTVAVKVVHAQFATDDRFRSRFRLEIEAGRRVGGDWTAPVLDADPDAATPWVATGYVAGPSVQQITQSQGKLPEHSVRAVGAGLAEALAAVHRLDLVHRDVKPSNVLVTLDGPRLIDFGIARAMDATASLTATGVSVGSPGFMSPEQVLGQPLGHATDLFSLGAVLVQAATGEPPFPGYHSASLLYKVVHEEPELHDLAGEVRELAVACLAKDASDRPTAAQVAEQLSGGQGAASLIVPGWLPGPVVEGVSRRAVELLELEAEPPRQPVVARQPMGEFGPPGQWGAGQVGAGQVGAGQQPGGYAAPPPTSPPPSNRQQGGGRRALTVALAAVGLAAVVVGALFLIPDNDTNAGSSDGGTSAGTANGGNSGGETGASENTIPQAFKGTWEGSYPSPLSGRETSVQVVVAEEGEGDDALGVRFAVKMGDDVCHSTGETTKITDVELTVVDKVDQDNTVGCIATVGDITLTLRGDEKSMKYKAADQLLGTVQTDLRKTG